MEARNKEGKSAFDVAASTQIRALIAPTALSASASWTI
jgi:hypothetical protein